MEVVSTLRRWDARRTRAETMGVGRGRGGTWVVDKATWR